MNRSFLLIAILLGLVAISLGVLILIRNRRHKKMYSKYRALYKVHLGLKTKNDDLKQIIIHHLGIMHKLADILSHHSYSCKSERFFIKCRQYFIASNTDKFILRDLKTIVDTLYNNKLSILIKGKNLSEKDILFLSCLCLNFSNQTILELFEFKNRIYIYNKARILKDRLGIINEEMKLGEYLKHYLRN